MDAYLFADLVPEGTLPDDGPMNRRRPFYYLLSLWFNADHEGFPPCCFEDYLSLRGWNKELLQQGQWRSAHPANAQKSDNDCVFDAIAVIQAWMTLGFLEDLYQDRTCPASYIHQASEETVTSMTQVINHGELWQRLRRNSTGKVYMFNTKNFVSNLAAITLTKFMKSYHDGLNEQHFARIPDLMAQYARAFNHLASIEEYNEDRNQTRNPISPETECGTFFWLTLSFPKLIFEAVRLHLHDLTPDIDLRDIHLEHNMVRSLQAENRWCPSIIEKLRSTTNFTVFHWLCASDISALDDRDQLASKCTSSKCHAIEVSSEDKYPEAHAEGCGGTCARFFLDAQRVRDVLLSGSVPFIVATPSAVRPSSYTFDVSSFEPKHTNPATPFVAFSHVWSDGLGSTTEKGMPSCQIDYLARVARSQHSLPNGGTAFWIDSLCVPVDSTARRKAIEFLASTYKAAHTVVVVDNTLKKVALYDNEGNRSSPEYLLFRIYTSPWSQRVWTYQEGVLAHKLVFLVAGGHTLVLDFPVDLDGGPSRGPLSIQPGRDMFHHVYNYLRAEVQALSGQVRQINIGTVALEVRWRNTLHRDPKGRNDEILAIGNVLRLDMAKLLNETEGPARMVLFFKLIGRLYRNIVFAEIPRLQEDGFRWAPTTFLVKDERRPHTDLEKQGVDCTEDGLIGAYVTFAVADGEEILYDDTRRVTFIDDQRSFDMLPTSTQQGAFSFTHIIIYPETIPESNRGTIMIAAAVREDKKYVRVDQAAGNVDFVGTFQCLVYLCWFREWDHPVLISRFPNGEQVVPVTIQKLKILLR